MKAILTGSKPLHQEDDQWKIKGQNWAPFEEYWGEK